jgi:hypothetical protein
MGTAMSYRFDFTVTARFTELRLIGPDRPLPIRDWALQAPHNLTQGVNLVHRLQADDQAFGNDDEPTFFIVHPAIARLSPYEASLLGLPPLAEVVAAITSQGLINKPDFTVALIWKRPNGQAIAHAERRGAWLRIGQVWQRLPELLFDIAEKVDALRSEPTENIAGRMKALAELREVLPSAVSAGVTDTLGALRSLKIAVADAFSLDLVGEGDACRLVPILHRARAQDDTPLLPPDQQRVFGEDRFNRYSTARDIYEVGPGTYVVLSPLLHTALGEVRRLQSASPETKRAFLASPRAFLRQVLGDDTDVTALENVFCETQAYSERVIGLGLWRPRVLPWVEIPATDWLGSDAETGASPPRQPRGLIINDKLVPLTADQTEQLLEKVKAARATGQPTVPFSVNGETIFVPATTEVEQKLVVLHDAFNRSQPPASSSERSEAEDEHVLIKPNEETIDIEAGWTPRANYEIRLPSCLRTPLKQHQITGVEWLQKSWRQGRPGVLLADDMGLGKTLQALAFLAWLREGMKNGAIPQAPLLIVAPTGLLENWLEEHERHLHPPGLGQILRAYGKTLAGYRSQGADGQARVSQQALRNADCVLTTYETLRDYDRDLGQIRFAAAVFDEAQKIKTPGIRLTDAAKATNADFRVAMTGTPVENRLADLWCIVDTVHPGHLGELKVFSARYEKNADVSLLRQLKDSLDQPSGSKAPLMLRRLRWDYLPDLPKCEEKVIEREMPEVQRVAYQEAIAYARSNGGPATMLETLHKLRRICLHPFSPDEPAEDSIFISASARFLVLFDILDAIYHSNERALIFIDNRAVQGQLIGLIQRRYKLSSPPPFINGEVPGAGRQARVNSFQRGEGFDVMILSPRAGGVGLTLTSANHAIHLERWWNPAVEDQCTGRVLRIGQTRSVTVHIPQCTWAGHHSFDQNLHALLQRKRQLVRETLGPGEFSGDELSELFHETTAG